MQVPFLDLRPQHDPLHAEISAAIDRVRNQSFYILGPELEKFEEEYARFVGVPHAIGVGNGLDALTLSLRALGIGPGDEVITTAHTYIATLLAISEAGAKPILVDCKRDTLSIDPDALAAAITPRTAAILPIHLYGRLADMESIEPIARRHGLALIEDAAQGHGARLGSQQAGSFGTTGCFSFYPTKNLGALGDGGAITTRDAALADKLRLLRNYGSATKYVHETLGVNSRLDELQAAILRVKLTRLDEWNHQRQVIAKNYRDALGEILELASLPRPEGDGLDHVYHIFVVRTPERDRLQKELSGRGVQTAIHYPIPVHRQKAYANLNLPEGTFPIAESAAREILSLPLYPGLHDDQFAAVVTAIRDILG